MIDASARTHAGRVRAVNEDAAVCRPEHGLFAVIDGMGGEEAGEVAAAIAAAAIAEIPNERRLPSETVLAAAFREARRRILAHGDAEPQHRGMGAVATAVRFEDNGRAVGVAHVGDTRAWIVGPKGIRRLTRDHVADMGGPKPAVARDLGRRELPDDWIDTGRHAIARGELLVLATDGLTDAVGEDETLAEIERLWRDKAHADAITARLVALALARGGPDNVTVVAARAGRFHRGRMTRRLGFAVSVALFLVMAGLAAVSLLRPAPVSQPAEVPARVTKTQEIASPAELPLVAGARTEVAAGQSLTLRGVRLAGPDWTVEVGDGAELRVVRSVVEVDGGWMVLLGPGAKLVVEDTRVRAQQVRLAGDPTSAVTFRDTHTHLPSTDAFVTEGGFPFEQIDEIRTVPPDPEMRREEPLP
ncbi:MAG: PP2C family protein-serine/threonine phosphatase [Myxococcota bacterium]